MLRYLVALAAVFAGCVWAAGCGSSSPPAATAGDIGASDALAPLEPPPAAVPAAAIVSSAGSTPGVVVASRWPAPDGTVSEVAPPGVVPWPAALPVRAGERPTVRLDAFPMPARVEVREFANVNSSGVPTDDGRVYVCRTLAQDGSECTAARDDGDVVVALPPNLAPYIVVYVEWYVPVDARPSGQGDVDTRSASYAFTLATT